MTINISNKILLINFVLLVFIYIFAIAFADMAQLVEQRIRNA